jgi:hypothetical protein
MNPGEQFSRSWLCGHFGVPRKVEQTHAGVVWRYGPTGWRGLAFLRHRDGRFTPL